MQTAPGTIPPRAAALLARAAALLRDGRPGDAVAPLREAAAWAPGNAAILHDLGLACLECGRIGDAVAALQGAVEADPFFADAHLRLGIALEAAGAVDAALMSYRRAFVVQPKLADAHFRLGALLDSLGHAAAAIEAFKHAAARAPKTTLGRMAVARAALAGERQADAERAVRQALALDRDNAAALELLGSLLADAGSFDEAREVLLRAIARAPLRAGAYYDVVRCRPLRAGDEALVTQMRDALAQPGLEPMQRARVHLALGKTADDFGNYAEAMQHFDQAQALRDAVSPFDAAAYEVLVDRLIAAFPEGCFAGARTGGSEAVVIVGLPRSGTTLVEQILSAHPDVAAGGELPFWNARGAAWAAAGDLSPLPADAASYLGLLRDLARGAARVTDKMPMNILWTGMIHLALPDAVIVHCVRAPVDTALSIHQTHFNQLMNFPTGGSALVSYIRATRRLAAHWRRVLPAERFIEVAYEDLTHTPEPVIRALVGACGLGWHDACLQPQDNARIIRTPSKWQARQGIYRNAAGRWRNYAAVLGPLSALLDDVAP